jgi:polyhydroxyalkanoate synthesis regulator phasin
MEDLFKKFINAGVGLVSLTNDRVQKTIDALVKESKLSEQEGARIMDDLKKNTDTKRQEMEKQFQGLASRLMKSAGIATDADVEELKRTVKGGGAKTASTSPAAAKVSSTSVKGTTSAAKTAAAVKATNIKTGNTTAKSAKPAVGKASGESKQDKANKTAAKKAISPNDNTSSSGSELS